MNNNINSDNSNSNSSSNIFNESSLNYSPNNSQFDTSAILEALSNNTHDIDSDFSSITSGVSGGSSSKRYSFNASLTGGDNSNSNSNKNSNSNSNSNFSSNFVGVKPKSSSLSSSISPPSSSFIGSGSGSDTGNHQGSGVLSIITNSIVSGITGVTGGGSSRSIKPHPVPIDISMDASINSRDDDMEPLIDSYHSNNASTLFSPPNGDIDDNYDPSTPLSPKDFSKIYHQNLARHSPKKFVHNFPLWLEEKFRSFDDPIIALCQTYTSKTFYYFSLFITSIVAIEIAIALPFVLFILGQDGLATEFTYLGLLLALFSQVPKRFLWRFRPYMVQRAKICKKDQTSSFPSRAVTCSVVYCYAIVWAVLYYIPGPIFQWWMPFLFITMILLSSFARINLGVHYPSDCVGGVIQGTLVCLIGTGLRSLDILGCKSCWDGGCYARGISSSITFGTLDRLNFIMLSIVLLLCIFVPIVTVMKPVDFWSKCDRVYGMLFPAMAFQLLLLCPRSYSLNGSLQAPPVPHWYSYVFGISLSLLATIFASKAKLKHPLIAFWVIFLVLTISLFAWRLSLMG